MHFKMKWNGRGSKGSSRKKFNRCHMHFVFESTWNDFVWASWAMTDVMFIFFKSIWNNFSILKFFLNFLKWLSVTKAIAGLQIRALLQLLGCLLNNWFDCMHFETIIILFATKFYTRMFVYFFIIHRAVNCRFRVNKGQLRPQLSFIRL